ncbi:hypothetical protein FRACYDRAFT_254539 [Fragilariopsis cylindrus CCMP1102]|uniref:Uncharacterized protein n=1 Tax=Fragilariopsis cylindrus CCMP1102 TaxID=635003 RepID=A0A1E7EKR9_9STRA|nr:hypothetical protein FRACYDRAFT_254539 [Fragilariopsis cylindrus CCMP1102]|eukprot:OEU06519.1 hypothetical protein FRACYDRAFT_254539 [Fragilariopsis cylindrus CCMP1102]
MLESEEETMNRKRRLLLQQSAKQSKVLRSLSPQPQPQPQPQQQNKRARIAPRTTIAATTKMTVSFDTMKGDEITLIPSLDDYTQNELESSYFSKNEYANIIQRVHQTVKYLRRKDTSSNSDSSASAAVVMEDENETIIEHEEDVENESNDYHCVRGLETYAEEYVGNHRKRVQRISKSAVFRYQKQQLRLKKRTETKKSVSNVNDDENQKKKNRNSSFRNSNSNSNSNIVITPIERREDVFATAAATATTAAAVTTMTMMMNNSWKNEFSKTPVSRKVSY